jgi:alpha-L-fucosidase
MKSAKECIRTLLQTVGGDGNLLFNVGPMPDGRIEPRQVERLMQMGAWLKKYSDGVYGTRGGPFKPGKWGASTCKAGKIYLYVMNWQNGDRVVLPSIDCEIISYRTFGGGQLLLKQKKNSIEIRLPASGRDEIATVIELTVKGSAFDINPVDVP